MEKKPYFVVAETALKAMCQFPEDLKIDETKDEIGILLVITANTADLPFLIGTKGKNANALRDIIRAVGMRAHSRVSLKING